MSLLATASEWKNNENKKRVSSIRKPKREGFFKNNNVEHMDNPSNNKNKVQSIEEMQNINEERSAKVTELLNEMEEPDEKEGLGNFEPIEPPQLNIKKEMEEVKETQDYVAPQYSYKEGLVAMRNNSLNKESYNADNRKGEAYSNYKQSYEEPKVIEPYYAKMGITGSTNDKLLEKMNYLVHMMEEQHNEKTNNITEEFILYSFLGVFIIFVVDSFNRTQKYVR